MHTISRPRLLPATLRHFKHFSGYSFVTACTGQTAYSSRNKNIESINCNSTITLERDLSSLRALHRVYRSKPFRLSVITTGIASRPVLPFYQQRSKQYTYRAMSSDTLRGIIDSDNLEKDTAVMQSDANAPLDTLKAKGFDNNNISNNNSKRNTKTKKKARHWETNIPPKRRRPAEDADDNCESNNKQLSIDSDPKGPHPGSYVCPEQRSILGMPPLSFTPDGQPIPPTDSTDLETISSDTNGNTETTRIKRKVALLVAYLGTDYNGFQINPGQKTLQAELEYAIWRAGCLDPRNVGYPHKYSWSTSGRTDKGVHACAQVVSCKLAFPAPPTDAGSAHGDTHHNEQVSTSSIIDTLSQSRELINRYLPASVRVLDLVRTTRTFCARTQRNKVRYQYMIPAFVLAFTPAQIRQIFADCNIAPTDKKNNNTDVDVSIEEQDNGVEENDNESDVIIKRHGADPLTADEVQHVQSKLANARVTPEQLTRLKDALQQYVGTHSYHNLSKGVAYNEARAKRYVMSFDVEDLILSDDGVQWIPTQVVGQSFLMHQIRKMVCLAMDVARDATPLSTMAHILTTPDHRNVYVAPAQALFLEMSYYDAYNRRKSSQQSMDVDDLDWTDPTTEVYQRWNDFRHNVIMKHVAEEEAQNGNFVKYLYVHEFLANYEKTYAKEE
jgi:tRNA pseudouridine38-40 synthase